MVTDTSIALRDITIIDAFFEEFADESGKLEKIEKEAQLSKEERDQIIRLLTFNFSDEAIINHITEARGSSNKKSELFALVESYRSNYEDVLTIIRDKFRANIEKVFRFGDSLNRVHLYNNIAEIYTKELDNYEIGTSEFNANLKMLMSLLREMRMEANLSKTRRVEDDLLGFGKKRPHIGRRYLQKKKDIGERMYEHLGDKFGKDIVDAAYEAMEHGKVEGNLNEDKSQ